MQITLPYGLEAYWTLATTGQNITRVGPSASLVPLADPALSVRTALRDPLDYPPLASATVPGDKVVVTIPAGMPEVESLARGVLQALLDAGVEPAQLALLVADEATEQTLRACQQSLALDHPWLHEVRIVVHDPRAADACGLVGVTRTGRPLRMNRLICEADLLVPMGIVSAAVDMGEEKPPLLTGLFPDFADKDALGRFFAPSSRDNRVHRSRRLEEIDEASWLLAGGMVVQVVPASQGKVAALFAGYPASVAAAAWQACLASWTPAISNRGDLAVCLLTGSAAAQSWSGIGRAIQAAEAVLEAGGTVVLCSELEQSPGFSLGRLCQQDDRVSRQHEIMRDREADSWPALQLSRALQRGSVYLHSRLENSVVENLGMAPIASNAELSRLITRHTHIIVLDDAQWLVPVVR